MPGLIGFVDRPAPGGAAAFMESMARALHPEDRFRADYFHAAHVGLGRVVLKRPSPDPQPVWEADGSVGLVMEGELYNRADLADTLRKRGLPWEAGSDAHLVLKIYREFGDDFAARLDGAFVLAAWEPRRRRLVIANDRLGLFPLYYAAVGRGLLFSSGVRALLADPELSRATDRVAINEFLVFNHVLHDRTLLESVRLLPQASLLTFENGDLAIRPYWRLRYPSLYEPADETGYAEKLLHYLRRAVRLRQEGAGSTGVLLSGGLDSRLLLAVLCEIADPARIHTFTWGIPGCNDARFAHMVATQCGSKHRFFELKPDWLLHRAEEAVRLTDGMGCITNLHALATLEEEARDAEVLYKGFMGDAMLGFAIKRRMWADYSADAAWRVHMQTHVEQGVISFSPAEEKELFTGEFQAAVGDGVYEDYRRGMQQAETPQLANQRLYFDLTQRVPRMTICGVEVVRSRCSVKLPFADYGLLDFVLTIPPGLLFERYLVKTVLAKHYPGLAKIPLTPTNLPLTACAREIWLRALRLAAWHLDRAGLGRLAPGATRPYKDYAGWFRGVLRAWLEGILLDPRTLARGYFNPSYIRRLLAAHMAGEDHAVRLGSFLTLELWHRMFAD